MGNFLADYFDNLRLCFDEIWPIEFCAGLKEKTHGRGKERNEGKGEEER